MKSIVIQKYFIVLSPNMAYVAGVYYTLKLSIIMHK